MNNAITTKQRHITVIHGPNLNLLGQREPQYYGNQTLSQINHQLKQMAQSKKVTIDCFQSNHEGSLVDWIQQSETDFFIINAAAYTHTSIAIRDALLARAIPFIEVHLSNPFQREDFRQHSYLSDIAYGIISGFADRSYQLALREAVYFLNTNNTKR